MVRIIATAYPRKVFHLALVNSPMSDFFEVYISSMITELKSQPGIEMNNSLKFVIDTNILKNILSGVKNIFRKGNVTLISDLDKLPSDIKRKLETEEYSIGESRQVDGNLRAVIVNENNVRKPNRRIIWKNKLMKKLSKLCIKPTI